MSEYNPKPVFVERMRKLLNDENDLNEFFRVAKTLPYKSIRVNTLKISPDELLIRLSKYGWKIQQVEGYPWIMQIISELKPGEVGKTIEHIFGYYYVQEITSMMPIIALDLQENEIMLDLCASPGSKTSEAGMLMNNTGTIIANDVSVGRISILSANLERMGVSNTVISRHDGLDLCRKLKKLDFKFDKISVDAPCSGEGNIRYSPRTYLEWSEGLVRSFGNKQKKLVASAFELLKDDGIIVYSTCTHSPEENEEVIEYLKENYPVEILDVKLPIKTRSGIKEWNSKKFNSEINKCVRIYHHDNNMEGFFLCKMRRKLK